MFVGIFFFPFLIHIFHVKKKIQEFEGSMNLVASSSVSWKSNSNNSDRVEKNEFPAGLRVLVVDDDPTCLRILEKMLRNCHYEGIGFCFF